MRPPTPSEAQRSPQGPRPEKVQRITLAEDEAPAPEPACRERDDSAEESAEAMDMYEALDLVSGPDLGPSAAERLRAVGVALHSQGSFATEQGPARQHTSLEENFDRLSYRTGDGLPGYAQACPEPPQEVLNGGAGGHAQRRRSLSRGRVRLVVFDFDQTLSCIHVFKYLSGVDRSDTELRAANTELGQLRLVDALAADFGGGFALHALGGEDRVERLRALFGEIRRREAEMVVCTRGYVGVVKKCLASVGLLEFFAMVYGQRGSAYGRPLPLDEREAHQEPSEAERELMGDEASSRWSTKSSLVTELRRRSGLDPDEALLVEDDEAEIRAASAVCRTVWIRERRGISEEHDVDILSLVS